jgi:cytochrome c oxidase subunit 4
MNNWHLPRALLVSWLGLLVLLGVTVYAAYLPLGTLNTAIALTIALTKAVIVGSIFMELRQANALTVIFAGAGFFWLAIMLWLALGDYLTRPA